MTNSTAIRQRERDARMTRWSTNISQLWERFQFILNVRTFDFRPTSWYRTSAQIWYTIISNPELLSRIWNYNQEKRLSRQLWRHRSFTSGEFLSLTDERHGSNYRNGKKYQSHGNFVHIQRKRFFFHKICGNELRRWVQPSHLSDNMINFSVQFWWFSRMISSKL